MAAQFEMLLIFEEGAWEQLNKRGFQRVQPLDSQGRPSFLILHNKVLARLPHAVFKRI